MSKIFISYRRSDSQWVTDRISEHLTRHFGKPNIYKDIDSIPKGVDFRDHIGNAVEQCEVLLVVIGTEWIGVTDDDGNRRIDKPTDSVRLEVQAALERRIPVIPIRVRGAEIPKPEELPESLKAMPYMNGMQVRPDPDFGSDIERLCESLAAYVRPVGPGLASTGDGTSTNRSSPTSSGSGAKPGASPPLGRGVRTLLAIGAVSVVLIAAFLLVQQPWKPSSDTVIAQLSKAGAVVDTDTDDAITKIVIERQPVSPGTLELIASLETVTHLELIDAAINDDDLSALATMSNLDTLYLTDAEITDSGLLDIRNLPELNHLHLEGCKGITDTGMNTLRDLKKMAFLTLSRTSITDAAMKELKYLEQLEYLDLSDTEITDTGLRSLPPGDDKMDYKSGRLANLKTLRLNGTDITAEALRSLWHLEKLEKLYLDAQVREDAGELSLEPHIATAIQRASS